LKTKNGGPLWSRRWSFQDGCELAEKLCFLRLELGLSEDALLFQVAQLGDFIGMAEAGRRGRHAARRLSLGLEHDGVNDGHDEDRSAVDPPQEEWPMTLVLSNGRRDEADEGGYNQDFQMLPPSGPLPLLIILRITASAGV